MEDNKIRIGITQVDINGVGYEVILKTFSDPTMLELCTPIIYGSPKVAAYHRKALDVQTNFSIINTASEAGCNRDVYKRQVPRTEGVAVDLTTSLDELKSRFIESGISLSLIHICRSNRKREKITYKKDRFISRFVLFWQRIYKELLDS